MWIAALALCLAGCEAGGAARTFTTVNAPGWTSIEVRDDVDYERAWKTVWTVLYREFDIECAMKDDGYLRTAWMHTWGGAYQEHYRVRVTVKFSDDRRKLDVKAEAQSFMGSTWVLGVDNRLVSTLKTDLMGVIGRTTR
jgi:hypothetical protein